MRSMHVHRIPNRTSPPAILLRESFRDESGVHKRTLANLSHWAPERVAALERALRGDFDHFSDNPAPVCGAIFGPLFALSSIAESVGVAPVLRRTELGKIALFLALARVAGYGSRLAALRWAKSQAVEETVGLSAALTKDKLYAALDYAAEEQPRIERELYHRYLASQATPPVLVLYDVTSVWLEGQNNELAEYGHDRDHRRSKKIIVVGLLTDPVGEPLAIRVFRGNRNDPTTVAEQIELLRGQFGIQSVVFVGDRGMVKGQAREAVDAAKFQYITALSDPQIRRLLREGQLQLGLFDETLTEVQTAEGRLVLRRNPATARKEQHRRQNKLDKLRRLVDERNAFVQGSARAKPQSGVRKLEAWVARYKLKQPVSFKLQDRTLELHVDQDALQRLGALDGCYALQSNVSADVLDAQSIHDAYMGLQQVERDFRLLKTVELELRPVFVRNERRTRGHVFVGMLALKVLRELRRRLVAHYGTTDKNAQALTPEDTIVQLSRLTLQHYELPGAEHLTTLPQPDGTLSELLEALGLHLPSRNTGRKAPRKSAR